MDNKVNGILKVPGDKSISHRSIMLLSLGDGKAKVRNILFSEDVLRTIDIFRKLGIDIEVKNGVVTVEGKGLYGLKEYGSELYCGNSGTTMRLLSGILVGQDFESCLTGDDSLNKRPMDRIVEPLVCMGGRFLGDSKKPPLKIIGSEKILPINYKMKIDSAQVKSAILLAGLYSDEDIVVEERNLSRNHTENMLKYLGVGLNIDSKRICMSGERKIRSKDILVPGDISSASYFMALALILNDSKIVLEDMGINPTRDGIIKIIKRMGGNLKIGNKRLVNRELMADLQIETSDLKGIKIEKEEVASLIDEIPVIAVISAFAEGLTTIEGVGELRFKEVDRLQVLIDELGKVGIDIFLKEDSLHIKGGKNYGEAIFKSHNDHRMAMSMMILAIKLNNGSYVEDKECINISYPRFEDDLKLLLNN